METRQRTSSPSNDIRGAMVAGALMGVVIGWGACINFVATYEWCEDQLARRRLQSLVSLWRERVKRNLAQEEAEAPEDEQQPVEAE